MKDGSLIPRFGRARRDPSLAVLEGFHPLKHALRFGARLLEVVTSDDQELERLAQELAPDVHDEIRALARTVDQAIFSQLSPFAPSTGVISLAERPAVDLSAVLDDQRASPIVLLENPRDLGNMGACVRVAAAADIAGVLSTGSHDPFVPTFDIFAKPITIGAESWIATDVFVAPGVTIGPGALIAARSAVFTNIPPATIARGTPAKVIGPRTMKTPQDG